MYMYIIKGMVNENEIIKKINNFITNMLSLDKVEIVTIVLGNLRLRIN